MDGHDGDVGGIGELVAGGTPVVAYDNDVPLLPVDRVLVENRAAALIHLFAAELDFQDAAAERDRLQAQLAAEQMALDAELKALTSAISIAQGLQQNLLIADRRCAAMFSHYRACLNSAAQPGQAAN